MATLHDLEYSFYKAAGGTGNTLNDVKNSYFMGQTRLKDPRDAQRVYLKSLGGEGGSIKSLWFSYLRKSGYTGTLNDMLKEFLTNGSFA